MRLDRAADAGDQATAADRGDDGAHVGQVLEDLQAHGAMAGDEIVIVERVDEGAVEPGISMRLGRLPRLLIGNRDDGRAERPHPLELVLRRGLDRYDRARNSKLPRCVRNTLSRITGADGPDTTRTLGIGQMRNGI